jgi:hypothetical protein
VIVLFGVAGQTLRHTAPEVISSATYEITNLPLGQSNADRVLASGAATVPAYTLTLDDDAGASLADPKRIPVTATAGPVSGDELALVAADGSFELFELEAVATDDYLRSRSLLAGEYVAGSTVRGVTITAPVPVELYNFEAALDDQRPLRVVWQYTTLAGVRRVSELLELTRGNQATASTGPAIKLLLRGYPEIAGRLLEGLTVTGLAEFALSRIEGELAVRGISHQQIMLGQPGLWLLVAKMLDEAARRGYSPGQRPANDFATETREDYETQLEALVVGTQGSQSATMDTDDVSTDRENPTYYAPIGAL